MTISESIRNKIQSGDDLTLEESVMLDILGGNIQAFPGKTIFLALVEKYWENRLTS